MRTQWFYDVFLPGYDALEARRARDDTRPRPLDATARHMRGYPLPPRSPSGYQGYFGADFTGSP